MLSILVIQEKKVSEWTREEEEEKNVQVVCSFLSPTITTLLSTQKNSNEWMSKAVVCTQLKTVNRPEDQTTLLPATIYRHTAIIIFSLFLKRKKWNNLRNKRHTEFSKTFVPCLQPVHYVSYWKNLCIIITSYAFGSTKIK